MLIKTFLDFLKGSSQICLYNFLSFSSYLSMETPGLNNKIKKQFKLSRITVLVVFMGITSISNAQWTEKGIGIKKATGGKSSVSINKKSDKTESTLPFDSNASYQNLNKLGAANKDLKYNEDDLVVFDIITPNGDGLNDCLKIKNIENFPRNSIEIYNRWGVKVFGVKSYSDRNCFKGISNGRVTIRKDKLLPVGQYYYALSYVNRAGMVKRLGGTFYINR